MEEKGIELPNVVPDSTSFPGLGAVDALDSDDAAGEEAIHKVGDAIAGVTNRVPAIRTRSDDGRSGGDIESSRSTMRSARIRAEYEKRRSKWRWYLHWDSATQTVRRVWTEHMPYRSIVVAAIVTLGLLTLGLGYIAAENTTYHTVLTADPAALPLTVNTNMCDVYLTRDELNLKFDTLFLDSFFISDVPPCKARCAAVRASLRAYDFDRVDRPNGLQYDDVTNTITVMRDFGTVPAGTDEQRVARCKLVIAWDGDINVNLLPGPGKLHMFTNKDVDNDFGQAQVNVRAADPLGFSYVNFEGATFGGVSLHVNHGLVHLRNVTVAREIDVSIVRGNVDVWTEQPVEVTTNTGGCFSAARVDRLSEERWDLSDAAAGPTVPVLPVRVSALVVDEVDLGVNVWSKTPAAGDPSRFAFETASVSRLPLNDDGDEYDTVPEEGWVTNFDAASGVGTDAANGTGADPFPSAAAGGDPQDAAPKARAVLGPGGTLPQPAFRLDEVARIRHQYAHRPPNVLDTFYIHGTGSPARASLWLTSWVVHKVSPEFLAVLTAMVMAPTYHLTYMTMSRGFCPAFPSRDLSCVPSGRSTGVNVTAGVDPVPVFSCTSGRIVPTRTAWVDEAERTFRPVLRAFPMINTNGLDAVGMTSPRDEGCYTDLSLTVEERKTICADGLTSGHTVIFEANPSTGSISVERVNLVDGAQPLMPALVFLSTGIALIVAIVVVIGGSMFARQRFAVFRMDALIQDASGRAHLRTLVRSTSRLYAPNDDDVEYEPYDFSRTRKGELSIVEAVSAPFLSRLRSFVDTAGLGPRRPLLKCWGPKLRQRPGAEVRPPADILDTASRLLRKLLLLARSSTPPFLIDAIVPSLPPPSQHPEIEEAVYWLRGHTGPREMQVILVSLLFVILPSVVVLFPAIVLPVLALKYRDQLQSNPSFIAAFFLLALALASMAAAVLMVTLFSLNRTGYEVRKWRRGGIYGGGRSGLAPANAGSSTAAAAAAAAESYVPAAVQRKREEEMLKKATHFDRPVAARELRWHSFVMGTTWACFAVVALCSLLSVLTVTMMSQWVLLGLFLNPAKAGPFATSLAAVALHVTRLRSVLVSSYNKILHMVKDGVARFKTDASGGKHVVFGVDIANEELRPFLTRRGVSMRTIILTILSSTLLILGVLTFIILGIYATTDPEDDVSAILGSLLSVVSVGGLSFAKSPAPDDLELRQLADVLVADYRLAKDKNRLTFSAEDSVLTVIRQADNLFSDNAA